jgi:hypothetical protein
MSDINLDFTVSNNSINFTVEPNDITITPTDIQLTFSTSSQLNAGGSNTQVQYNNGDLLAGSSTFTFNNTSNVVTIGNANIQNGIINASNITSAFTNLGNVGNVKITGGVNGYVLQTDGTGNLDWTAAGGGGGNGTPGGSNTQIQYNDSGVFGGNAGFTFNEITGNVNIPGNLSVVGNVFGNVQTAYLANFATTANAVAGANVSGFVANASNANLANFATTANAVAGANVSGQVANALIAGTVYTNAQPNITSVGTLTSVNVSGNTTLNSTISLQQAIEKVTIYSTANTGVINYDLLSQAIIYNTANATANIGLNFRANSSVSANTLLSVGNSMVATYMMKTGSTAYTITNVSIDGTAQSIRWAGNTTPNTYPSSNTSFVFTIVKTAATPTYAVFGSSTRYA